MKRLSSIMLLCAFVLAALLTPISFDGSGIDARAQSAGNVPGEALGNASDAELWRLLRRGTPMTISDPKTGPRVIIQSAGEEWRAMRNGPLMRYGGYLLAVAAGVIALFAAVRRRIHIEAGFSGRTVPRFTMAERLTHWMVASLFILLGVSGLIIMFGKFVLVPVIGSKAYATVASAMLQGHNLFGPLYIFAILAMFALYVRDNILRMADIQWMLKGGFLFRGHAPSWKYNAGEKGWFWIGALTGVVLSISGILMDFPWLAESREQLQLANLAHGAAAIIAIGASMGHIYLATLGVEGAWEGMITGEVDENWAKEHHDLWAEQVIAERDAAAPAEHAQPAE